ncbi:MAG: hypothetical protein RBS68_00935 [Anaerolineales bacterium]|nr:hypothetical protein [Anaerolineales bacterium]
MMFLIDVGENSPQKLTLVRLVMKGAHINLETLWQNLNNLPEEKHMDRKMFEQYLEELVTEEWLWKTETEGQFIYSPRLKTNEGKPR